MMALAIIVGAIVAWLLFAIAVGRFLGTLSEIDLTHGHDLDVPPGGGADDYFHGEHL